jgi:hypothetical protein
MNTLPIAPRLTAKARPSAPKIFRPWPDLDGTEAGSGMLTAIY